jgi:hypothetical protein
MAGQRNQDPAAKIRTGGPQNHSGRGVLSRANGSLLICDSKWHCQ